MVTQPSAVDGDRLFVNADAHQGVWRLKFLARTEFMKGFEANSAVKSGTDTLADLASPLTAEARVGEGWEEQGLGGGNHKRI